MPSRAERRRPWEPLLHLGALALLAVSLWRALAALGTAAAPRTHARLAGDETPLVRDSLAALARAGTRVTWSGEFAPVAAVAEPVREPAGGWRVSVVSARGASVGDAIGAIDTLGAGGGSLEAGGVRGDLVVRELGTVARVAVPDAPALGRVLVLGRAGWESKFVVAALEEAGWMVDAELRLSDTLSVRQGSGRPLSTATHAVAVVLDPAPGAAASIERFVRAGGGLILAGEGAASRAFRAVAPATVLRVDAPVHRAFAGNDPFDVLPWHRLGDARRDAVVLQRRGAATVAVARRVGAGRVVQASLAETWRWRMEGEEGSPAAHRAYWSRLMGAAAPTLAPTEDPLHPDGGASAPLAATIGALGPPSAEAPAALPRGTPLPTWLGALVLALLLAEWASRRTRGAV